MKVYLHYEATESTIILNVDSEQTIVRLKEVMLHEESFFADVCLDVCRVL